jgi:hypothetical protein
MSDDFTSADEHRRSNERIANLDNRLTVIETIVLAEGGLRHQLAELKTSVDALRTFQVRAMTAFGAVAVVAQVLIQLLWKR